MKLFWAVLALSSVAWAGRLTFTEADADFAYQTAAAFVKDNTPRDAGTLRGLLAAGWLLDRASRTGVDATKDTFRSPTPDGEKTFANVVVELPGTATNAPWVVVMSHFDTAPNVGSGFEGANDGASTSGLLVALAGALRRAGRQRDNVMLVWTDGEECRRAYGPNDGFHGSRHLVETLRRRKRAVRAAICLDMLGDRDLEITVPANTTPVLKKLVVKAAEKAGVASKVKVDNSIVVKDDHSAFLEAGCPAIDLIDFNFGCAPGMNDFWHTPQDTIDKISAESLLVAGRLTAELLNLLENN